jgi:hypothetical protein
MNADGSAAPDGAGEQDQLGSPAFNMPSSGDVLKYIGDVLKLVAITGGVVYIALFIGYRKYYGILSIRPEDVGANTTFILVRSIGFVFLALLVAGLVLLITALLARQREGPWSRRDTIRASMAIIVAVIFIASLAAFEPLAGWLPVSFGMVVVVGCVALTGIAYDSRMDRLLAVCGLVVAISAIVLLPAVGVYVEARDLGASTLNGSPRPPFAVFGIPVLDVSADEVQATWICPTLQRPNMFKNSPNNAVRGRLLGETGTGYYIRLTDVKPHTNVIIKLPQNCALLTRFAR